MQKRILTLLLVNIIVAVRSNDVIKGASHCMFAFGSDMQIILFLYNNTPYERCIGELGRNQLVKSLISFSVMFRDCEGNGLYTLKKSARNWLEVEAFKRKMLQKIDRDAELPNHIKYSINGEETMFKLCSLY